MNLHPEDIEEVLGKGWGERHPLAWEEGRDKCGGWLRSPVPGTFVMVYAPRGKFCRFVVFGVFSFFSLLRVEGCG